MPVKKLADTRTATQRKKQLKRFYVERTDVSFCYIDATSVKDAQSKLGSADWSTIVGEESFTETQK